MNSNPNINATADLLDEIYKSVKMGTDSINSIIPKIENDFMLRDVTAQLEGYSEIATRAATLLSEYNIKAEDEKITKKLSAKFGIAVNTLIDSTPSNIAEIMIKGSQTGIKSMQTNVTQAEMMNCDKRAINLANDLITFEQSSAHKLKEYTGENGDGDMQA